MADEKKNPLVTEVTEAYCQIYGEIAIKANVPVPRPDPHDTLALAVWCVLEGRKAANLPVPDEPPAVFTYRR